MGKTGQKIVLALGVLLAMTLFLWGCPPNRESMGNTESNSKESSMNLEKHTEKYSPVIPALDAAVPAVSETASFGLG
jgi:hypothetical protein